MPRRLPYSLRRCQTLPDCAKRSPRQYQTLVDTPRQSTTVPRGLPDSLRRCQTLPDGAKRSP
ncbi:hypothetical protein DPMN_172064 [Dreissena polymorpha]|uniref:Uncharacterized protein n=1 Tax=Dreissena polymorpha TaxID=45954 RepID=A0A9D4E1J9_DREPO|nr:hypothetical protein DPMN_172064 [Dreissena polymorpha]